MFLVRRLAARNNSTVHLRCYCAPSSSSSTCSKLFVGGLSWAVDEKSLKEAFSSFGDVTEVRIMYDKDSGRSRGFGFVHFLKDDDARSAREAMDGKAFLGRPLRISYALEKARGGPVVVPRLSNVGDASSPEQMNTNYNSTGLGKKIACDEPAAQTVLEKREKKAKYPQAHNH